jgi:UDP-N-acetylglucosamine 2-epimerase (non-hydrolysing)
MACALVAAKERIPIAHVEAGLRSFDRSMPEEINRVIVDSLADLLFTTEQSASDNLLREGISPDRIVFVGNVMIDSLIKMIGKARRLNLLDKMGLSENRYVVLTMHRPSNVDSPTHLAEILEEIDEIARELPVIFPVHPRTLATIKKLKMPYPALSHDQSITGNRGLWLIPPASYLEFLC